MLEDLRAITLYPQAEVIPFDWRLNLCHLVPDDREFPLPLYSDLFPPHHTRSCAHLTNQSLIAGMASDLWYVIALPCSQSYLLYVN
jgi:hypothetical protein